jgi:hypothetical protein
MKLVIAILFTFSLGALAETQQIGPAYSCSDASQSILIEKGIGAEGLQAEEIIWVEVDGTGFESTVYADQVGSFEDGVEVYKVRITGGAGTMYNAFVICQ